MKVMVRYRQNGSGEWHDDILGDGKEFPNSFVWDGTSFPTITCCNQLCKSSYLLGDVLSTFVKGGQDTAEGYLICRGNESSPKGRRVYRRCANSLRYHLSRVEDTPQDEAG